MNDRNKIEQEINSVNIDKAIEMLDHNIERQPDNAEWWYMRGRLYWRINKPGNAISDFEEAVHLDPSSDAAHALKFAHEIMDFYNPDLLNP